MKVSKAGSKSGTSKLWMVWPDIHFPEHDEQAVALATAISRLLRPDCSLFLGDCIDAAPFSSHPKNSVLEERGDDWLRTEVGPCNALFDEVQSHTKELTHYLEGNHEHRIQRTLAKFGGMGHSLESVLSVKNQMVRGRKNFRHVPYGLDPARMRVKLAPKLWAVHGWSTAQRAAAVHLAAARNNSIIFGHCHRQEELVQRDPWTGDMLSAACPGTLSTLTPSYIPSGNPTSWIHGIRLVWVSKGGNHTGYNVTLNNGSAILPDGREVRV